MQEDAAAADIWPVHPKLQIKQKQCTKGNANAKSNIYFIIWMEIDTCCYRATQSKANEKKNGNSENTLTPSCSILDATDKIEWNTRVVRFMLSVMQ